MKKVAVMLPIGYRGGSLRAAKNLAKGLALTARQRSEPVQVVFSYNRDGSYDPYSDFSDLIKAGVALRETTWQIVNRESVVQALEYTGQGGLPDLVHPAYCLPVDGANDFYDCDLWIIISDRLPAPLFTLKKYACVIYDYVQRYVPQIFGNDQKVWDRQETEMFTLVRQAARLFVTTPSTRADMIAYAGVPGGRVSLIEMDFEPPADPGKSPFTLDLPPNYLIWTTNTAAHKNHIRTLQAMENYYQELGGSLDMVITGVNSEYLDIEREFDENDPVIHVPQIKIWRSRMMNNPGLKRHIHVLGNVTEGTYARVLQKSRFLWHPNEYDNGTYSVIEAAYFQRPSLAARYPAMEFIDQKFKLGLTFFDPHNPMDMANSLLDMEKNHRSKALPDRKDLIQRTWQANAPAIYQAVTEIIVD